MPEERDPKDYAEVIAASLAADEERRRKLARTLLAWKKLRAPQRPPKSSNEEPETADTVVNADNAAASVSSQGVNIEGVNIVRVLWGTTSVRRIEKVEFGPTIQKLMTLTPHELAALVKKSISPSKLGFHVPDGLTEEELPDLLSAFAGAEAERAVMSVEGRRLDKRIAAEDRKAGATWKGHVVSGIVGSALTILAYALFN